MVTGVETAGLVLAALPLIVEGLQGYLKGIHTIQRFLKMEKWLKQYLANVENCEVVVRQFIERVLLESEIDVDVDKLLDSPGCDLWQDTGLEKQLRKYLGRYYEKYMQTIGDLSILIDELREKLHLNKTLPAKVSAPLSSLQANDRGRIENASLCSGLIGFPTGSLVRSGAGPKWSTKDDDHNDRLPV